MSDFVEKIIKHPEVCNYDSGEVILEAREEKILTRPDVPFRSITDLKGYNDNEVNIHSSIANDANYIPLEQLVCQIFRSKTIKELQAMQVQDPSEYDEEEEYETVDDPIEQMEYLQDVKDYSEQNGPLSADAGSEHSGAGSTTSEGENGEAVSSGNAE